MDGERVNVIDYGPQAWLVEVADPLGYAAAVHAALASEVDEVVLAAATVLVTVGPGTDRGDVQSQLASLRPLAAGTQEETPVVEIPVVYDGDDLDSIADATGLAVSDAVARHSAPTYRCAFCGFAPGFAYLTGLDKALELPRRATPRTRIPAGAVAIAAGYTAVYPSASPGGWHLLGRTDVPMWRTGRAAPALIVPGATVRFVEVSA